MNSYHCAGAQIALTSLQNAKQELSQRLSAKTFDANADNRGAGGAGESQRCVKVGVKGNDDASFAFRMHQHNRIISSCKTNIGNMDSINAFASKHCDRAARQALIEEQFHLMAARSMS